MPLDPEVSGSADVEATVTTGTGSRTATGTIDLDSYRPNGGLAHRFVMERKWQSMGTRSDLQRQERSRPGTHPARYPAGRMGLGALTVLWGLSPSACAYGWFVPGMGLAREPADTLFGVVFRMTRRLVSGTALTGRMGWSVFRSC
jgi:hypothetical protein